MTIISTYNYKCINESCTKYNQVYTIEQGMNDIHESVCSECNTKSQMQFVSTPYKFNCGGAYGKSSK